MSFVGALAGAGALLLGIALLLLRRKRSAGKSATEL
jgi:LPXTG-motif cell wall-anchored protein